MQGWLEALLPSHRWIRWEIATSVDRKYWEGIPGFLLEPTICGQAYHLRPNSSGRWKSYVPCWDKEYKTLYRSFIRYSVGTDSDRTVSSLLSRLQQKKQKQWEEAVNSIDVSHSATSRGAPSTHLLAGLQAPFPVPRLGKPNRLATSEERGTQEGGPQVHQAW